MLEQLPSIFIVGPMGAGKTTIGRLLARQLGREFVDSDWYIEAQTGADIPWIFAKEGEAGFRDREMRAIDELTARPNIVLATGGGAVMRPQNRENLHHRGIVVYLNAPVDVQMARTAKDKSRPLLQQPNPRQILENLYRIRDPLYRQVAHIILPTGHTYPRYMVTQLLKQLGSYGVTPSSDDRAHQSLAQSGNKNVNKNLDPNQADIKDKRDHQDGSHLSSPDH